MEGSTMAKKSKGSVAVATENTEVENTDAEVEEAEGGKSAREPGALHSAFVAWEAERGNDLSAMTPEQIVQRAWTDRPAYRKGETYQRDVKAAKVEERAAKKAASAQASEQRAAEKAEKKAAKEAKAQAKAEADAAKAAEVADANVDGATVTEIDEKKTKRGKGKSSKAPF